MRTLLVPSVLGNSVDHYGNTHCLVTQDGKVLWVPPSQFSAYCDLSLRKWPYDQHTCFFFFGSWVYDGEQIKLKRPPRNSSVTVTYTLVPFLPSHIILCESVVFHTNTHCLYLADSPGGMELQVLNTCWKITNQTRTQIVSLFSLNTRSVSSKHFFT